VTQFRRRSWQSPGPRRNEGMRLSTMIVLLVVVLVLMAAASRPEIWSHLFPSLDQPAPAGSAEGSAKMAPEPAKAPHTAQTPDQNSRLLMGGLIVVAIAYAFWRITRLTRAITARSKHDRTRFARTEGASQSPVTAEADSDGLSEAEPESPVPIEEPEPREGRPPIES
jgi:hypothetical protein